MDDNNNENRKRLHQEISRVVESIPDQDLFIIARIALCWLCVSARPLQARELWLLCLMQQIHSTQGSDELDVFVNDGVSFEEETAVASLTGLLGGLVSFQPDIRNPGRSIVTLSDPELATTMFELRSTDLPASVQLLGFNFQQANMIVTGQCAVIISRTALRLGYVNDQSAHMSSLILYAWTHWTRHWCQTGWDLSDPDEGVVAEMMMIGVVADALVFLLVLNDFLTSPIHVPVTEDRVRCTALVKQAQDAMERPIYLLSVLAQGDSATWCTRLHQARQKWERRPDPYKPMKLGTPPSQLTKVQTVWIDHVPRKQLQYYNDPSGLTAALIYIFADIARDLRSLAMIVSQRPIYEELLKEYDGWLPLDILINVANFMEGIASYPFMSELPNGNTYNPLIIKEPSDDPDYDTALLVLSRLTKEGAKNKTDQKSSVVDSQLAANAAKTHPLGLSDYRLRAASFVEKVKNTRRKQGATYTINDVRLLSSQRTSSFATFPNLQAGGGGGGGLTSFLPSRLSRLLGRPTPPSNNTTSTTPPTDATNTNSGLLTFLDSFAAGAFTGGAIDRWPLIKTALLSSGYLSAFIYFVVAIILNHIRNIFCPWLGNWMWYTPMEDLRLALGNNPAFFLEYALGFSWFYYAFSFIQKSAWDFMGGVAIALLSLEAGPEPVAPGAVGGGDPMSTLSLLDSNPDPDEDDDTKQKRQKAKEERKWKSRKLDCLRIGYLLWTLATIDHMFSRSLNTVTFIIAWYKLAFRGGDAEHLAMAQIAIKNWTKMPLHVSQLYFYVTNALWPILLSSLALAVTGQPGMVMILGAIVAGVWATIRFRSKVFIALEVSGVFVVMGLVVVSVMLLGAEFWEDPVGLKQSTASARKRGVKTRGILGERAKGRVGILRKEGALSLWPDSKLQGGKEVVNVEEVPPVVPQPGEEATSVGMGEEKGGHLKTE
ncbi:hypothetical protein B0T20DRAFT_489391 [Sordaria brevicollis]|uniref:Uncharacterized protein n=1 Tax=Sordaria brevicollis TaxID=83679 RepID=A0AAE0P0W0_SORBR|nr:hypothetical protein B0T20DRAFT_489391 [Sordaria brevicollis]